MDPIRCLPRREGLWLGHLLDGPGEAYAVVWPGVGARQRSLHHVRLQSHSRLRPLRHAASEAVYCVLEGGGRVNERPVASGQMWFLPAGRGYVVRAGAEGMVFVGGPCPPDAALYGVLSPAVDARACSDEPLVVDVEGEGRPLPLIARHARLVVGPWNGASVATLNHVVLEPGEGNVPHVHPDSEDSLYIVDGRGFVLDGTTGAELAFGADCCLHIPAGLSHRVRAAGDSRLVSVGGPCPPDLAMLRGAVEPT